MFTKYEGFRDELFEINFVCSVPCIIGIIGNYLYIYV